MNHRVPVTVSLESFEGPLDLLLYLIQSHEMDISQVSVSKITDQYLRYVRMMQELNFDIASEFLVIAATLIYWKSKSLLPQEDAPADSTEEEEPLLTQEELVRQLLEHQRFREAGRSLGELSFLGEDVFTRPSLKPPVEKIWKEMNLSDLTLSYQDSLVQARKRKQVLRKETVSIGQKIREMAAKLKLGELTQLEALITDPKIRAEVVVAFLASLELSKLKKLKLHQLRNFDPIFLELIQKIVDQDLELAISFENTNPTAIPPTPAGTSPTENRSFA